MALRGTNCAAAHGLRCRQRSTQYTVDDGRHGGAELWRRDGRLRHDLDANRNHRRHRAGRAFVQSDRIRRQCLWHLIVGSDGQTSTG